MKERFGNLPPPAQGRQRESKQAEGCRVWNRSCADGGSEGIEELLVLRSDWNGRTAVGLVEVGVQRNEVGDGHLAIIVDIAFLPGAGLVEMRGELDEVGD